MPISGLIYSICYLISITMYRKINSNILATSLIISLLCGMGKLASRKFINTLEHRF